jgi:DNA-binding winged helix-turn-helix (wHTH) protein
MMESQGTGRAVRFGPFMLDLSNRLLSRDGADIPLPPRATGVLWLLVTRAGHVVSKQELLEAVWKDTYVNDDSLAEAISLVRHTLGDDAQQPAFIQTVPRRGYRFVSPIERAEQPQPTPRLDAFPATEAAVGGTGEAIWTPWLAPLICLIAGVAIGVAAVALQLAPKVASTPIVRLELGLPLGWTIDVTSRAVAISRAGDRFAVVVHREDDDVGRLGLRRLDQAGVMFVPDSEGAEAPFFSPDGRWVAFFARGRLFKAPAAGGAVEIVADAPAALGGLWTERDQIVFASRWTGGLETVSSSGGPVRTLTTPDALRGEVRHAWPSQVAGRRDLAVFTVAYGPSAAAATMAFVDLDTGRVTRPGQRATDVRSLSATDFLLLGERDARVVPLDLASGRPNGPAATITDAAVVDPLSGAAAIDVAATGTRIAVETAGTTEIRWLDASGGSSPAISGFVDLEDLAVAPDGQHVAGVDRRTADERLVVVDLSRNTRSVLATAARIVFPVWSPDGQQLAYAASNGGPCRVMHVRIGETAAPRELYRESVPVTPTAWTHDGRWLVIARVGHGGWDLAAVDVAASTVNTLAATPADEIGGVPSPDGRWFAYAVNRDGGWTITVRALQSNAAGVTVVAHGQDPVWMDATTLTYVRAGRSYKVSVSDATVTRPTPVAPTRMILSARGATREGRVLIRRSESSPVVTLGWGAEVEAILAARRPLPTIR